MRDVITFGSATVDIFVESKKERVVQLCTDDHCENLLAYASGEKILIEEPHIDIGGGGTNTAACLAQLGLDVAYCGCVGQDDMGNKILSWLAEQHIPFLGTRSSVRTNMSVVLDSQRLKDRTILIYKGASDDFHSHDINWDAMRATWFYFSSLLGQSYKTMIDLMRYAREQNIAVAFNPSHYQAQHGLGALQEPIRLAQLLVLNKEEAEFLVGVGSIEDLCRRLRDAGGEIVMVTDAENGAAMLYQDMISVMRPRSDVHVLETTGAGDCFASSFLGGLILGLSPEDALRLAFINAESLIGVVGPKNGLLTREEALARLAGDTRLVEQHPM